MNESNRSSAKSAYLDFYLRIITSCQQNACFLPHLSNMGHKDCPYEQKILLSCHKGENEDDKIVENENVKHQRNFTHFDRCFSPQSEF